MSINNVLNNELIITFIVYTNAASHVEISMGDN